jgi:hypothetical protein
VTNDPYRSRTGRARFFRQSVIPDLMEMANLVCPWELEKSSRVSFERGPVGRVERGPAGRASHFLRAMGRAMPAAVLAALFVLVLGERTRLVVRADSASMKLEQTRHPGLFSGSRARPTRADPAASRSPPSP